MKNMLSLCFLLLIHSSLVRADITSDSIYHLKSQWINQNGHSLKLSSLAGKKQVVAMFYTHCLHTCPLIVSSMQALQNGLSIEQRKQFNFVLVSLSPDSDTPTILNNFAKERELDEKSWLLLTSSENNVRGLAMALEIKYKSTMDNEVAHSNLFTILDEQGSIILQEMGTIAGAKAALKKIAN